MNLNEINLEFIDFPYICRICLFKGDTKPFTEDLQKLVLQFLNINIEDELPNNICPNCIDKLNEIKNFIDLVLINNERLQDILLKHKHKVSLEDFDNDSHFKISEDSSNDNKLDADISEDSSNEYTEIKLEDIRQTNKNNFYCKICEKKFISNKDLINHRKQNSDCAYKCEVCNKTFETNKQLHKHRTESINCIVEGNKCNICNKIFKTNSLLKRHQGAHKTETPFACKLCDKKFKFPQNLKRHDNIVHKGVKPFKCDVCGKEWNDRVIHLTEQPVYVCAICKESGTNSGLPLGQERHNGKPAKKKMKCVKEINLKLQCSFCNKVFTSKSNLRKHLLYHGDKRYLCITCGKSFYLKQQFDEHFLTHTGEKPHRCKECGKTFRLYNYYKAHLFTHTGERPYQCHICKHSFIQKSHLTRHLNIHTGNKPFECQICWKKFSNKSYLGIHNKIHTGETNYVCGVCNKGFYDTSNLKRHLLIHK